jgi:signal peptidase
MRNSAVVTDLAELLPEPESFWSRELALVQPAVDLEQPAGAPKLELVPQVAAGVGLSSRRSALKRAWAVLPVLLVLGACVFWALFLRPQTLGGPAAYVLVSGHSMLPRYHTGDLVLVEKQSSYHVGQVIAYRVPKGDPMAGAQVIHRIIGGDAKRGFLVQGDNRTAPDVWRPKQRDIVGAKALRIPNAVLVLQFVRSPILLGLLAASFVFVHLLTGGKREEETEPAGPHF